MRWDWLHENPQLSDVLLRLVPPPPQEEDAPPAAKKAKGAVSSTVRLPHAELPAHKTVLATASEYFRAHLLRWRTADDADTGPSVLEEQVTQEELPSAQLVIRYMYTQQLPEDLPLSEMIQVGPRSQCVPTPPHPTPPHPAPGSHARAMSLHIIP